MSVSINIKAGGALYEDILKKIDKPLSAGTQGQVLASDGQGGQTWSDLPESTVDYTDLTNKPQINGIALSGNKTASDLGLLGGQDVSEAVEDWLDDHPEATTTVQDGAISYAKLDSSLKGSVDDVSDLKSASSLLIDEIPGTSKTVTFDSNGNPTQIVHSDDGTTVRTDVFTWGTNTVTEVRTLSSGKYIEIETNLTTLAQTISEVLEVA